MSSIVISGDTSGSITVAAPAVAGTNTATLPAATGTVMVSGNMPAFSAYLNTTQVIPNNTLTKITCSIKTFDTNSCYDNVTNYRFTPTVAGYYQFNLVTQYQSGGSTTPISPILYKNGGLFSPYQQVSRLANNGSINQVVGGSVLYYANGSTDYFEFYASQSSGGNLNLYGLADGGSTYFQAFMVRAA